MTNFVESTSAASATEFLAASKGSSIDAPQLQSGKITMHSTAVSTGDYVIVPVGFTPRHIRWYNTTGIYLEWFKGMADDTCLKRVAAGDATLETTNKGITVCDSDGTANASGRYFKVSGNTTLIAVTADDIIYWVALG